MKTPAPLANAGSLTRLARGGVSPKHRIFAIACALLAVANFRELRASEVHKMPFFPGTSVSRTIIAVTYAGDLRAHTAVIIQHWVQ